MTSPSSRTVDHASKPIVILLGPPGSGKGTQAQLLSKALNLPHISTGDLFRSNIANQTPLGMKVKSIISSGKLVPDDLVLEMLFERILNDDCKRGFLLDGFPRTILQAEALDKKKPPQATLVILNLHVADEVIEKRAEGRLTCKQCGSVYNKYSSPSAVEEQCDKCQGELHKRPDDQEDVVKERLRVYRIQTEPLIAYYQDRGIITINGEAPSDVVFADLMKRLDFLTL